MVAKVCPSAQTKFPTLQENTSNLFKKKKLNKRRLSHFRKYIKLDKYIVIEFNGDKKAIFKGTDIKEDGRMEESAIQDNWNELLRTIKEAFHLTTTSSFVLVKSDNTDEQLGNGKDLLRLWNNLAMNKTTNFFVLKMRCLEIAREKTQMTWCPKKAATPNFREECAKEDWGRHWEDLKQFVGLYDADNEYLQDEGQKYVIGSGEELRIVWSDRYDNTESGIWCLRVQVAKRSQYHKEQGGYKKRGNTSDSDEKIWTPHRSKALEPVVSVPRQVQEKEYFDIALMLELVKKAEGEASAMQGENVLLFLGGTGSGKSTLVHFLAGSTMERQVVDGKPHIGVMKVKNEAVRKIVTSARAMSETKHITAVPIDLHAMEVFAGTKTRNIVLCDTPGFEDTGGTEVEVANGVGIVKALQTCKSVKPVVLISYIAFGHRMNNIKALARTLAAIVPSIENYLSAFSYVFTKVPADQRSYMHAWMKGLVTSRCGGHDSSELEIGARAVLQDIARKTKVQVLAPDPLKDSPNDLLEQFADVRGFIQNPKGVFHPFLSDASKSAVHMQLYKQKDSIFRAFQSGHYTVAKTMLDQLAALDELLPLPSIHTEYSACVRKLTKNGVKRASVQGSDNVITYRDAVVAARASANVFMAHVQETEKKGEEISFVFPLNRNLHEQIDTIIRDIHATQLQMSNVSSLTLQLDNLAQVQAYFPEFDPFYNEICQKLHAQLAQCMSEAKECIPKHTFPELRKQLETMTKMVSLQRHLCPSVDVKQKLSDLETELLHYLQHHVFDEGHAVLNKATKRGPNNLRKDEPKEDEKNIKHYHHHHHSHHQQQHAPIRDIEKLDQTDVSLLETVAGILSEASLTFASPCDSAWLTKKTKEMYVSLVKEVVEYFEDIGDKLTTVFEKQKQRAADEVKEMISMMNSLRRMKAVKERTERCYRQTIGKVFDFVREVHKDISSILDSFDTKTTSMTSVSVDYSRLYDCI
ncbi:hypothetical protein RFI_08544, partial [Reticulomyxa filosa]